VAGLASDYATIQSKGSMTATIMVGVKAQGGPTEHALLVTHNLGREPDWVRVHRLSTGASADNTARCQPIIDGAKATNDEQFKLQATEDPGGGPVTVDLTKQFWLMVKGAASDEFFEVECGETYSQVK